MPLPSLLHNPIFLTKQPLFRKTQRDFFSFMVHEKISLITELNSDYEQSKAKESLDPFQPPRPPATE